jgi:hypothetical protein
MIVNLTLNKIFMSIEYIIHVFKALLLSDKTWKIEDEWSKEINSDFKLRSLEQILLFTLDYILVIKSINFSFLFDEMASSMMKLK